MNHILDEDEEKDFLSQIKRSYKNYKKINSGNWTNEVSYKEGIVDFCDALISASRNITYDISRLRNEVEALIDEIDNEVKK